MKCPYCGEKVGMFSKEMNKPKKKCPHCHESVNLYLDLKKRAIWLLPIALIGSIAKVAITSCGLPGFIMYGFVCVTLLIISMQLKTSSGD